MASGWPGTTGQRRGRDAFCSQAADQPQGKSMGFQVSTNGKESACQSRRHKDMSLIPGLGRFPGGGNGNPFRYSCLEDSTDRGDFGLDSPWGRKVSDMTECLSTHISKNDIDDLICKAEIESSRFLSILSGCLLWGRYLSWRYYLAC